MTSGNSNNEDGFVKYLRARFEKTGEWSFDNRWIVLLICIAIIIISSYFSMDIRFDNSFEAFFDQNDPTYLDFLQYREDFGSDEISYIIYEAPDYEYGPWNMGVMKKIRLLVKNIEDEVPFVKRTLSPANLEFMEGAEGKLIIYDLLSKFPDSQEKLLKFRDKVMKKPMYIGGLISKDARYGGIMVEMEKSSIDPLEEIQLDPEKGNALDNLYPQVTYTKIEEILSRPDFKGIKFYHSGDIPLNAEYNVITQEESATLGAISFVIIALLLVLFFRRFTGVIGPLLVVLFSTIITIGIIGIIGWDFDLMFSVLPTILIVVGVADSVHVVTEFRIYHRRLNGDSREAIKKTLSLVGVPCLFTSLTTVAGFISMSISPIKAIEHFAVYSAIGVFIAFLLSVTLLVVLLSFSGIKAEKKNISKPVSNSNSKSFIYELLMKISDFDIKYKKLIVFASVIIIALAIAGMSRLKVDSNWLNEFSESVEVRKTTEIVDDVMGGMGGFSYLFDAKEEDGILHPDVLRQIERLQQRADKETSIVMKTYSIVDLVKDINMSFNNGNPEYYSIPDSKDLVAQYLLLYEMSGGEELRNYISSDYSRATLDIRCKVIETSVYADLVERLNNYIKSRKDFTLAPTTTGIGALWIELIDYITESQIRGFLLAFIVIACMMCMLFKSFKIGLISMVPNLSPIFITLGIMGWINMPLDYVKLLIGCVAIGIAVDDTIHLLTRFHHEFLETGDYEKALRSSMKDVGRALFITTVVLVTGFLVMMVSRMDSLGSFGILVAMTLGLALFADFFIMPALVLVFKPFGPEFKTGGNNKLTLGHKGAES